ncbi:hypothetical protein E2C01_075541 [Portunus trituberculatus]|uniref:Uncharacterized protein n=1 Tax=Portunus trituberculatus TaxID=210409 RepID=A0A5B7IAY2_PORTR|nr:hypothetical protein [Portunus trituberculatus]
MFRGGAERRAVRSTRGLSPTIHPQSLTASPVHSSPSFPSGHSTRSSPVPLPKVPTPTVPHRRSFPAMTASHVSAVGLEGRMGLEVTRRVVHPALVKVPQRRFEEIAAPVKSKRRVLGHSLCVLLN